MREAGDDWRLMALAAVFASWWIVSAINQYRAGALTVRIRRHVPFALIPLWTFFAPNPARADSRLVWREECGGDWRGWRELHFGHASPRQRWLLNPELILNKAITDLANSLLRVRPRMDDRSVLLSGTYLALLSLVAAQPKACHCSAIQFALVRSSWLSRSRQIDVVFVSEAHEISGASPDVHPS